MKPSARRRPRGVVDSATAPAPSRRATAARASRRAAQERPPRQRHLGDEHRLRILRSYCYRERGTAAPAAGLVSRPRLEHVASRLARARLRTSADDARLADAGTARIWNGALSRCRARSTKRYRRARRARSATPRVVVLEAAAERVGQQLLGQRRDELLAVPQQRLAQPDGPVERRAVRQRARGVDRRCPRSPSSRHRPTASKFSSANPSGSIRAWQLAQAGFARCCSMRSRIVQRLARLRGLLRAPARSAAAAAAACRAGSRASTCRAAPARCGSRTTSPSGCCPARAARAACSSGERRRAGTRLP